MQNSKKRQQFAISIRRKQVSQKLQALRSQLYSQSQINYQKYFPIIDEIKKQDATNPDPTKQKYKPINTFLKQLKILSYSPEGSTRIFSQKIHHHLYGYMGKQSITTAQYTDILTILINLCVHVELDIPPQTMLLVAKSILDPEREMVSLWLLANIMYQKSTFGASMAAELLQSCDAMEYMEARVQKKWHHSGDIVIFNFFASAFLVVSGSFPSSYVSRIFKVIEYVLKYEEKREENFWFLSQALIDHGMSIGTNDYQIFGTNIMKDFQNYCKNKKTKYVKNYLKMLLNFVKYDKLAYQKFLKYQIFTHLDFCLQNRFHEVKKLCAQIGSQLIISFSQKVDIQNIGFFQNLILQLPQIQKHPQQTQTKILHYSTQYFNLHFQSLPLRKPHSHSHPQSPSLQTFLSKILQSKLLQTLCSCLSNANGNKQLIGQILNVLEIFIRVEENIGGKRIIMQCKSLGIGNVLEGMAMGEMGEGVTRVERFSDYFK